jgi:surface protein
MASDTLKQIADNLGVTTINGSYLSGIADYYGVDLATSDDLMADILVAVGGNPANSTDYLQDIVLTLGGTVTINGNWMEAWEAVTAVPPAPVNTVEPVVSGTTTLGSVLTTTNGTWTNSPTSFTYKWRRGASIISGATSSTYTLVYADSSASISSEVTAINAGGSTAEASGNAEIADNYTPVNTVAPVISGSTPVGSTLTTTNGTWTNSPSLAYQWYRGATLITSATAATYVTVTADTGLAVTCQVTGTNAVGSAIGISNSITPTAVAFAFTANTNNTSTGSSTATQFKLPLTTSTGLNIVVDWGDATTSTITSYLDAAVTHTYASLGTYSISITGTLPGWQFVNTGDKLKILNIASYGVLDITTNSIFRGCTNLTSNATDAPTITSTDLSSTFRDCTNFNNNIGSWNVAAVTNMTSMFNSASAFNQNISSWNTSAVTNMSNMFNGATNFNQNISSWNTAAVTTMAAMFTSATAFNQPIGSWNTAAVTNMNSMFSSATVFNQALSFNTGAVTTMASMFQSATAFNQPLSFNTSAVTSMSSMFNFATAFNQNLGALNVALVTNFSNFMATKTPATFSTANLDAIYNGWVTVQSSRTITFGTAKHSAAGTAGRAYLTGTKLWTITDGGL